MDGIKKADMPAARLHAPTGVKTGTYRISPPLVKPSRLTSRQNGGVGKQLSDGWCCNFAIGCSHGCNFCYVDEIWKRFGQERYGKLVLERWGDYMLVPENIEGAIEETQWKKWAGKEVMMSSTHDAFLPTLAHWARRILEAALPEGVEFCIQTRSFLVTKCFDLLSDYREQIRLQVSIATMDRELARRIEKRVPPPAARLEILRKAKEAGLDTGVILAPIFPAMKARPDAEGDLRRLIAAMAEIRPDHIYGESLHLRGQNLRQIQEDLQEEVRVTPAFDKDIARTFHRELEKADLKGTWWYEH